MQDQATPNPISIDEYEAARLTGLSVHTLRKDRVGKQRIPFYRIGRSVRYNVQRLQETLTSLEVGGAPTPRASRRRG